MQETTFKRTLKLSHVVYLGLAWMTPMIYFSVYGIASEASSGMLTQAYALAFLAIFFTALSYGIMAKRFSTSGSAYTYVKKSMNPIVGFLVGWALLLDYFFSPLIACLTFGLYIHAQFPSIPAYVWMIALNVTLAIVTIIGINFSANLSKVFVWIQIAFIAIFSFMLLRNVTPDVQPLEPLLQTAVPLPALLAGASIICFCFLGFDSITTMAEETIQAEKTIPRAILIIICTAVVLYLVPSYLTQLVHPNVTFTNIDSAGLEIVKLVGGAALSSLFMVVLILAIFTQGLASMTSVSRLLFVMGRENVLPKRMFGFLHPKFKTPVLNILIVSAVSLIALAIDLETAVKFVSFGALVAFIFVNLAVIAQCYIRDGKRSFKETWLYLIFPLTGAGFIGWLLSLLDSNSLMMGSIWLVLGILYYIAKHAKQLRSIRTSQRMAQQEQS
ncbi:APC family permease [Paenibacillus sp. YYML68]|uniref:APC family permease n=1 Tax=Paenibacillus sp. YYML68 TaxID=2909250 RepID=UPI00248FF571|nr:APC family permease [Paenibacillus sp. YYML68]